MGKKARRRRSNKGRGKKRGGGIMVGMRSGFKDVANAVTGSEETSKKTNWIVTALLIIAAGVAVYVFLHRG